jgi:hypothetical protein
MWLLEQQLYEKTQIGEFFGCLVCLASQRPTGTLVNGMVVYCSVADLHHFDADADTDPVLNLSADPDKDSVPHENSCESETAPG